MSPVSTLKILQSTDLASFQVIKQSYSIDSYFFFTVKEYIRP